MKKFILATLVNVLFAATANANPWLYQCQFRDKPALYGGRERAYFQWIYTIDPDYQNDFKILGKCTKYNMTESCEAVVDLAGKSVPCNKDNLGKFSVVP